MLKPLPAPLPSPLRSSIPALAAALCMLVLSLAACTTADYTSYEYRNGNKVIDGEGGSKRLVDGVEIWDAGDPPHRYRIMGMLRVSDYDQPYVNLSLLHAIAQQVRRNGGSAAILLSGNGGMRRAGDSLTWHERLGLLQEDGYRTQLALLVQYLPEPAEKPAAKPLKTLR
ncbi:hypothetical protein [Aquitalea magnusonii]|uniref:Lipoprotein n=2 Tax=Aquitalea magnusonii TaxID=332411 RepID=A0A318JCD5_9NEIS|nr:hypothetical protein [Aquitalea magnusonii]PXX44385.1 hypothetical protein DFR38_11367 [Aquitalea magnusonii]